jgi:hypothetical protein
MERHQHAVPRDLELEILEQMRDINRRLIEIEQRLPNPNRTWLTPREMSKLAGVSTRTLQTYVKRGKLSNASYRKDNRGKSFQFRYHRELVLKELDQA